MFVRTGCSVEEGASKSIHKTGIPDTPAPLFPSVRSRPSFISRKGPGVVMEWCRSCGITLSLSSLLPFPLAPSFPPLFSLYPLPPPFLKGKQHLLSIYSRQAMHSDLHKLGLHVGCLV